MTAPAAIQSIARLSAHLTLHWERDVLAVRHVRTGDRLDVAASFAPSLFPAEQRRPLFVEPLVGRVRVRVPEDTAAIHRMATVSKEIAGPADVDLAAGDALEITRGAIGLCVCAERASELAMFGRRTTSRALAPLAHVLAAGVLHAAFLLSSSTSMLAAMSDDDEADRAGRMRDAIASAEARSRMLDVPLVIGGDGVGAAARIDGREGNGRAGGGQRAGGEQGKAGSAASRASEPRRWAAPERVRSDPAPALSREQARADAVSFGMIGLLAEGSHAPKSPFGDLETFGLDGARAAGGAMWGFAIGEAPGAGGLGLGGIGEGGGGEGGGVGLGSVGTLGHTDGNPGSGTGGRGSSLFGGSWWAGGSWDGFGHRSRAPHIRYGGSVTAGTLPPDAIQRIVRQNFGRFRLCYERGLVKNPALEGRVSTRFLIGPDGVVKASADTGSSLPDAEVVACIVRAFHGLAFPEPAPAGASVTVTYPLVLRPG